MPKTVQPSLIITTYNRPDALKAVLLSVADQQHPPLEVLVADDGSGESTREMLASMRLPCLLTHVWQEDDGFRAASIRNRAAARAQGNYLIFLDGDCVLQPHFVEQHIRLAESGWFVAGQRLLLSERFSSKILQSHYPIHKADWKTLLSTYGKRDLNRLLPLLALPDSRWRKKTAQKWQTARTCNLGVWANDFEAVNGFDERFNGWGYEDSDLAVRLIRAGIGCKSGRYATGVFHLWHKENDRSRERDNHTLLQATLNGDYTQAKLGLDQYSG